MKIICIGRNYRETIEENNQTPLQPIVVFMKPDTAIHNLEIPYYIPDFTQDLYYEIELVLKINQNGKCISEKFAHKYYDEIAVGIDFTACDLQAELSQKGLSWEQAKAFDSSAIVGKFVSKEMFSNSSPIEFHLDKDGSTIQHKCSEDLILSLLKYHSTLPFAKATLSLQERPKVQGKQ